MQLGWDAAYLRDQISTILIDGSVVDSAETAVLVDGATLCLSAAMPGLVGATLRKGGFYASMRSQISWTPGADGDIPERISDGTITVRLYNMILREKTDALLARGILVDQEELTNLLGESGCASRGLLASGTTLLRAVDPAVEPAVEGAELGHDAG